MYIFGIYENLVYFGPEGLFETLEPHYMLYCKVQTEQP